MFLLLSILFLGCLPAGAVAAPVEQPSRVIVILTETQIMLLTAMTCCTFLSLILVVLDQTVFSQDYKKRHGLLLERMANIINARMPPSRYSAPIAMDVSSTALSPNETVVCSKNIYSTETQ